MNGVCIHLESAGSASLPQATSVLHSIYLPIVIPLVCIRSTRYASMRTEKSAIWHHNLSDTFTLPHRYPDIFRTPRSRAHLHSTGHWDDLQKLHFAARNQAHDHAHAFICARCGYRDTCFTFYTAQKRLYPSPSYLCTTSRLQSKWCILCLSFI